MQIITFKGGLGNQLFEYTHYLYLKGKYPQRKIYAYLPERALNCHNGFELDKRFEVEMPPTSKLSDCIGWFLHNMTKVAVRLKVSLPFIALLSTHDNENAILQEDYFQFTKYAPKGFSLRFKLPKVLSESNVKCINQMEATNSVAIHIRRGDYLKSNGKYRSLKMADYYKPALDIVKSKMKNIKLFVFSDDIDWCKEHLGYDDCVYVNWNHGEDSFLDMYLMTRCKAVITANSTFSYWAALLNPNDPLVVLPDYWGKVSTKGRNLQREGWILL